MGTRANGRGASLSASESVASLALADTVASTAATVTTTKSGKARMRGYYLSAKLFGIFLVANFVF
jgi:hypothetical protein